MCIRDRISCSPAAHASSSATSTSSVIPARSRSKIENKADTPTNVKVGAAVVLGSAEHGREGASEHQHPGGSIHQDSRVEANIPAGDLQRARDFYADKLGLTPTAEYDGVWLQYATTGCLLYTSP